MAGPGAFFINGGVYPEVPSHRPFAFYGFNYERGVAEMMHDACHRTEATLNDQVKDRHGARHDQLPKATASRSRPRSSTSSGTASESRA